MIKTIVSFKGSIEFPSKIDARSQRLAILINELMKVGIRFEYNSVYVTHVDSEGNSELGTLVKIEA